MEIKETEGKEMEGFKPSPEVEQLMQLAEKRPWLDELGFDFHTSPEELERLVANSKTLERLDEVARAAAPSVEKEQPEILSYLARFKGLLPLTMSAGILLSPACSQKPEAVSRLEEERQVEKNAHDMLASAHIAATHIISHEFFENADIFVQLKNSHPEIKFVNVHGVLKNDDGSYEIFGDMWVKIDEKRYTALFDGRGSDMKSAMNDALQSGLKWAQTSAGR